MKSLPKKAQLYLICVYIAALISILCVRQTVHLATSAPAWELVLYLALAVVSGSKKIRLMRHHKDEDVGSMSLGFAIFFAAMLRFGPAGGMVVSGLSCLSGCLYPKRQPIYQLIFNVSLTITESLAAGAIFVVLNGGRLLLDPVSSFPAILCSCTAYFLINTGCVAMIIALCSDRKPIALWKETFLWTAPSYFTGACISALALILFGHYLTTVLLFVSPAAFLTYQFYAVYTGRAEEKQQHIEELQVRQEHLADLYLATIKSLALAIDAKDQYTHQHILRVQRYAVATAKHMGITGNDLEGITTGALLHDIGKLGVPEYVLLKPGRLTEEEFNKVKKHPEIGAAILDPVDFPWPVLPVVKYHHEKWDGTGYPEGLKGEDIPLLARILSVADVYDALTSTRSYRNAWTHDRAIEVIKKDTGTHFDPVVVEAFLEVIYGVVEEMAKDGDGPLVPKTNAPVSVPSKAAQAARDIQRASSELWALYEVAQTLSSSLGLQETLEILARKLAAILPGTACLFLLRDPDSPDLVVRTATGLNQEFFQSARTMNDESISWQVCDNQKIYLGEYVPDDILVASCPTAHWTPISTALIVPIVHQGEKLGAINIYHPCADAFSDHDVQLLEMIAERAALAIYNGLLFDRTRSQAYTDSLTGLHNVRYLTQYVDDYCQKIEQDRITRQENLALLRPGEEALIAADGRAEDAFALLCLDLDSFKPINDNFGHQKGDQVLRDLGAIFQSLLRPKDVVARYGGDEFLIVLDGAGLAEAEGMMGRVKRAVESYDPGLVHEKLGALRLGVSIGFACYPHDGEDCATLLSVADSHMYGDKTERKLGKLIEKGSEKPEPGLLAMEQRAASFNETLRKAA